MKIRTRRRSDEPRRYGNSCQTCHHWQPTGLWDDHGDLGLCWELNNDLEDDGPPLKLADCGCDYHITPRQIRFNGWLKGKIEQADVEQAVGWLYREPDPVPLTRKRERQLNRTEADELIDWMYP